MPNLRCRPRVATESRLVVVAIWLYNSGRGKNPPTHAITSAAYPPDLPYFLHRVQYIQVARFPGSWSPCHKQKGQDLGVDPIQLFQYPSATLKIMDPNAADLADRAPTREANQRDESSTTTEGPTIFVNLYPLPETYHTLVVPSTTRVLPHADLWKMFCYHKLGLKNRDPRLSSSVVIQRL